MPTQSFTGSLAGTSSLASTLFVTKARVSQVATESLVQKASDARISQVATEVLIQTHHLALVSQVATEVLVKSKHPIETTLAGTSSLAATLAGRTHSLPVTFSGTSSLVARLSQAHIYATLAGTSTLTFGPYDIGGPGARLSQLALEVATQTSNSEVRLSQVTLEVARARSGLHIWDHS